MFSKLRIMKLTIPASYITTGTRLKHRHIVAVVANVLSSSVRQAREIISSQFIHVDSNSVNTLSRPDIKERGLSLLVKPQPGYLGCAVRRYWRPSTRLPRSRSAAERLPPRGRARCNAGCHCHPLDKRAHTAEPLGIPPLRGHMGEIKEPIT